VRKLDGYFRMIFHPVTTFKLPGGEIAFNCGVKDSGDADLIIIFPNDFPDHMPEVRARLGRETSSLEPYPSTKWTGMRSIEAIVKDALAKLREKEKQAKRSKNPRLRSLGRSNN
jgi:hypothetical protein